MDPTLLIALLAATLSILLLVVMVVLLVVLAAVVVRSRSSRAEPTPAPVKVAEVAPAPPAAPRVDANARTTEQQRAPEPPSNMIGFFDDESSVPNMEKRSDPFGSGIPASAFNSVPPQRFDDESDGNDGEATEIFSASQLGAEFAEFLEDDEPSGRLR
ncbi:MAG: hypothetical protein KC621_13135 [Myxococcales bacterium]|nr:hypothetical protein [Myxococcales bacterium]